MLSKRRAKLKETDVSSTAAGLANKARKALEELNYLSWLILFVKVCKTKSNLSLAKKGGGEASDKISMKANRITKTRIPKTKVMKDVTMKINTKQMNYRIPWKKVRKKLQKSETHYFWNENWQEKWKKTKLKVRKHEKS